MMTSVEEKNSLISKISSKVLLSDRGPHASCITIKFKQKAENSQDLISLLSNYKILIEEEGRYLMLLEKFCLQFRKGVF